MLLLGDYHTHTIFSHGTGSISENVKVAEKKGLIQVAITDHGFGHPFYGIKEANVEKIRRQIAQCNKERNIKVLYGIEANLIGLKGEIDLNIFQEQKMDLVLLGYHNFATPYSLKSWIELYFANKFFYPSKRQIQKNTDTYLYAIDKHNIDVLTHLNYGVLVDSFQIAKLAKQKNVFIELNGKRTLFSPKDVEDMLSINTQFIINSDAHSPNNVGNINVGFNFAVKNKIPFENIVNLNSIPNFKNHKIK